MKTIKDIREVTTWKEVLKALKFHYPDYKYRGMKKAFDVIKRFKKRKHKVEGEVLEIKCIHDDVLNDTEDGYYSISTNLYSMSFRRWAELSNIPIEEDTFNKMKLSETMAHFLYEITWYGTEESSRKLMKELHIRVKDLKQMNKVV